MDDRQRRVRDRRMIRRHHQGVPIATICGDEGVTHTILYEVLATAPAAERHARIIPWTADEDRTLIDHHEETAKALTDRLPGRTCQAVKWRRSQLRKRGELPPWQD